MKKLVRIGIRPSIFGFTMGVFLPTASATVVTFDDLTTAPFPVVVETYIPSNYAGFQWSNWGYYDQDTYNDYYDTTVSAPSVLQVAFNTLHRDNSIQWLGPGTINLVGASFLSWFGSNVRQSSITIQGWNDGQLVNSAVVSLNTSAFLYSEVNLNGIDEIRMQSANPIGHFAIDNLTYVPEPSSILLGVLGSAALITMRRRTNP